MKLTCLSKGSGFYFPPCHILDVCGFRILLDCPLDLSALTIFSPVPSVVHTSGSELINAEPWYKTAKSLHLWDPSSIDIVLISSMMGMLGLPFLTRSRSFSAKIYATEATARLGQLMMEDLISMHMEYHLFYGSQESGCPEWMKWEELELLPSALKEVVLGKNGKELGGWMPLYSSTDVKLCMQKVQTLKYAEVACYNGALILKAFSSGLEIGSSNWTIGSPKGDIACVSSSTFVPTHAMEFNFHALQENDVILFSDLTSMDIMEVVGDGNNNSAANSISLSTLRADEINQNNLGECILTNADIIEEKEKLTFLSSCIVDSVKAGGSVLIPSNRLAIVLQLLELIPGGLESSAVKVPIYIISSVATELLAFTNVIPEWLSKEQQEKLFSGESLFSHVELLRSKKLHVFPAIHSPELLTNWQEPCIIISPLWSLRLGPVVHLLHRWHEDENSLLVLEESPDVDLALLPFMPLKMKVLQCSFLSGISLKKAQALLKILQPKIVLLPEESSQHMNLSGSSSQSFSVFWYKENETLDIKDPKDSSDLDIAFDVATRFCWRKLKQGDMDITRLDGQLLMDHGKHCLVPSNEVANSSQGSTLLSWGVPDLQRLLVVLSELQIDTSMEQGTSSDNAGIIIRVHGPQKALIEAQGTRTIISSPDKDLASLIFEAVHTVLDGI